MPVPLTARPPFLTSVGAPAILAALARATASVAGLDQAAACHPLLPALLHRARLEAARRQAAADGQLIEPWHLAALIEGLRPRRVVRKGGSVEGDSIVGAGRTALSLYQWLTSPNLDEEKEARVALGALERVDTTGVTLLDAALGAWRWLDGGGHRAPLRAALVRFWVSTGALRAPLPLTGAAALQTEVNGGLARWTLAFLAALADEAEETLDLLYDLEHDWSSARHAITEGQCNPYASRAVDLLVAVPLMSATTLACALGIALDSARAVLCALVRLGVAAEVTGHTARPLFGLTGLMPIATTPRPRTADGVGGRSGRRPAGPVTAAPISLAPSPVPFSRQDCHYSDLTVAMAAINDALRATRVSLDGLVRRGDGASSAHLYHCESEESGDEVAD